MPWDMSSSLSDDKLFFGPKHIYAFMILFGLFDLIQLFVCQICHVIVKQKNENKQKKFKFCCKLQLQHWLQQKYWSQDFFLA